MSIIYQAIVEAIEALKRKAGLLHLQTHTFYGHGLDDTAIVVDLGANVGQFAGAVTKLIGCSCYAVEAIPEYLLQIEEGPLIKKIGGAISNRDGPVRLYVSNNREGNSIDESVAELYGVSGVQICDGVTFESFLRQNSISRVDLLKVDIEGAEARLFDSTSDQVLKAVKQITIEFHDFVAGSISTAQVKSIVRRLKGLGFHCLPFSYIYPTHENTDLLFINRVKMSVPVLHRIVFFFIKLLLNLERAKARLVHQVRAVVAKG